MGPTTMSGGDDVRRKKICIEYEKILCVWYSEAIKKELKENNKKTKSVLWTERRLCLFSTPLSFISSPYIRKKMAADDEAERRFCIYEYVKATLVEKGAFATPKLVRSLRLCANSITETATFPPLSGTAPYLGRLKRHVIEVHFEGWRRGLPRRWDEWFKRLASKRALQFFVLHWLCWPSIGVQCPRTNTFVFPWAKLPSHSKMSWFLEVSRLLENLFLPFSRDDLIEVRDNF